jgi:hypothetical protein
VRTPLSVVGPSVALAFVACGGGQEKNARYPERPEGCDVKVFADAPSAPIDNIGPVTATCGSDVSNEDCIRTLKDQACKLGGDVVWGVSDVPEMKLGKKHFAGRAAHTKTGK